MQASARAVRNVLVGVALLTIIGGILYAHFQDIPPVVALPLAAAFAVEACLYVASIWETARKALVTRLAEWLVWWMTASGVAPYLLYAVPSGVFRWQSFCALLVMSALVSFWYAVIPRRPAVDLLFVSVVAAGLLVDFFPEIYARPAPRLQVAILGQLMWTRLAILEALVLGRMNVKGLGFFPDRREWAAGFMNFALFLPAGVALGWALRFASFHPRAGEWWQNTLLAAATFLGMLWVVALREEFFFRGLLQRWFQNWMGNPWPALILASVLFGAAHLWFREFPNWRFATLAAVAGLFYGRAYLETRSVRAAMVTHALVNTTWRMLFS